MTTPRMFAETTSASWRLASGAALLLAVIALWISPEFSLLNLGASLIAGLASFLVSLRAPRGFLTLWIVVVAGLWLSPLASLDSDAQRLVYAFACIHAAFVYQGRLEYFFAGLALSFVLALGGISADLNTATLSAWAADRTVIALLTGLAAACAILFLRIASTRANDSVSRIGLAARAVEAARHRVAAASDDLLLTRENILGRARTHGESSVPDSPLQAGAVVHSGRDSVDILELHTTQFEPLVAALRKTFSDFQIQGRADGRIAGPIRFVFFAPAAGYDEKSVIAVDLPAMQKGLEACLNLALESLPEIGTRRREGVIRLSIRYGLRVIEVAVEDNGRGLTSRNLQIESDLASLKDLVPQWGGKLDRLIRLGVGSRTALELRILRERPRSFRATLRHQPIADGPHA